MLQSQDADRGEGSEGQQRSPEIGARPIALKGAALSTTLYDGRRFFSDLDVLVDRTRLPAVYERLRAFGYEATDTLRHREFYEQHHFHRHLTSPMKIPLEITGT